MKKLSTLLVTAAMMAPMAGTLPVVHGQIVSSGPVAHYTFDDGTGRDVTGNGHDAQNFGANPVNGYMDFNGVNSRLTATNVAGLPTGNAPRSIAYWFKTAYETQNGPPLCLGSSPVYLNNSSDPQRFCTGPGMARDVYGIPTYYGVFTDGVNDAPGGNNLQISGGQVPSGGTWHHMVFTYDGNGQWQYFLDGSFIKGGVFGKQINTFTNTLEMGAFLNYKNTLPALSNFFYKGSLDDVRIYNRVITSQEITQIAGQLPACTSTSSSSSSSNTATGPVAHYTFDDGTGRDVTGNGHDAQNFGANPVAGYMDFNGVNSRLSATNVAGIPTGNTPRTVSYLFKTAYETENGPPLCLGSSPVYLNNSSDPQRFCTGPGMSQNVYGMQTYYGVFTDGVNDALGGNNLQISGGQIPSTGNWHRLAFTYDGNGQWQYYLDGFRMQSGTFGRQINTLTSTIEIGAFLNYKNTLPALTNFFYKGSLDDVRIYNRVLSATEIAQMGSSAPVCPNQPVPQCRDGIDNDGDGATDYPADFSCSSAEDNDETNPKSQCQDGIDNDNDGKVDFPQDPGCSSKQDNDEFNIVVTLPACSDGMDNDNDGKADFFDAGCYPNNVFNPALYNPNDTDESNAVALCRWTRVNSQWVRSCI